MAQAEDVEKFNPTNRIKLLGDQASSVRVDIHIPAKRYFRSSLEMTRMAKVYSAEHNLESAFVLYQKYLSLVLEQLPKHPEYDSVDPVLKKMTKMQCKEAFKAAEEIKDKLKAAYEETYKQKIHGESLRLQRLKVEAEQKAEAERRLEEENEARLASEQEAKKRQDMEAEDRKFAMFLEKEMEKEASRVPLAVPVLPSAPAEPSAPAYPTPVLPSPAAHPQKAAQPGLLPIDPPPYSDVGNSISSNSKPVPSVDRSTKPSSAAHFTQTSNDVYSSNRHGLKTVTVPVTVSQQFRKLAHDNTSRNAETCGLLFGKLEQNAFHITHVVVPKQKGAPDSCTMLNEEEIFQFHDEHELIQLGWIHTHPTQTAFLSSVDLHTHVGYQIMMPEAIAIVVAPKFNEVGIFHLTPEHGLDYISKCSAPGFHPHPKEPPLFQQCDHVTMDASRQPVFVDLR